jgi:hypothetical protein
VTADEHEHRMHDSGKGSTPRPDPTLLTTAALTREISSLKELIITRLEMMDRAQTLFETNLTRVPTIVDTQIQHLKELLQTASDLKKNALEERFSGMDRAIALLNGTSDQFISLMDGKVESLRSLQDEKLVSIAKQFQDRDVWAAQQKSDNAVSVGAALQAAKELVNKQSEASDRAIGKSEASTTKQIDQLGVMITSLNAAMDGKLNDIKDRITRLESKDEGSVVADATHTTSSNQLILIVSVLIALAALLFGIYEAALKR